MFTISSGGVHEYHSSDFCINRPQGYPYSVLLILKCESLIHINGKEYHGHPQQALILPHDAAYTYYNPDGGPYIDDWIHFTGSPEDMALIHPDSMCRPFSITNPAILSIYFQQLLWESNYAPENIKKQHVHTLFCLLLDHLMDDFKNYQKVPYSPHLYPLQQLRLRMQANPGIVPDAKGAAAEMGLSLSYFQHLYRSCFGSTYQQDLIHMRVEYAQSLLVSTSYPIHRICELCGYRNEVHFFRQFRTLTGITPGEYRNLRQ